MGSIELLGPPFIQLCVSIKNTRHRSPNAAFLLLKNADLIDLIFVLDSISWPAFESSRDGMIEFNSPFNVSQACDIEEAAM